MTTGHAARYRPALGTPGNRVDVVAAVRQLVTKWLAEEQHAEAARTRQEGLFEPLTDRELTILRMLPAPASLREVAADLFVTPNTRKTIYGRSTASSVPNPGSSDPHP